jgi:hypothetical protein
LQAPGIEKRRVGRGIEADVGTARRGEDLQILGLPGGDEPPHELRLALLLGRERTIERFGDPREEGAQPEGRVLHGGEPGRTSALLVWTLMALLRAVILRGE